MCKRKISCKFQYNKKKKKNEKYDINDFIEMVKNEKVIYINKTYINSDLHYSHRNIESISDTVYIYTIPQVNGNPNILFDIYFSKIKNLHVMYDIYKMMDCKKIQPVEYMNIDMGCKVYKTIEFSSLTNLKDLSLYFHTDFPADINLKSTNIEIISLTNCRLRSLILPKTISTLKFFTSYIKKNAIVFKYEINHMISLYLDRISDDIIKVFDLSSICNIKFITLNIKYLSVFSNLKKILVKRFINDMISNNVEYINFYSAYQEIIKKVPAIDIQYYE